MPQLAAESALAARISRPTADSELEDLVLVQTEDLRDSLTDELLLAQRDPTSMDKGTLLAQIEAARYKKYCSLKDHDGNWYWKGKWNGSNEEECWCYGSTGLTTEGWITTKSQDRENGIAC